MKIDIKAPAKIFSSLFRGWAWPPRPHSSCATDWNIANTGGLFSGIWTWWIFYWTNEEVTPNILFLHYWNSWANSEH